MVPSASVDLAALSARAPLLKAMSNAPVGALFGALIWLTLRRASSPCGSTSAPYMLTFQAPFSGLGIVIWSQVGPWLAVAPSGCVVRSYTLPDGEVRVSWMSLPGHSIPTAR